MSIMKYFLTPIISFPLFILFPGPPQIVGPIEKQHRQVPVGSTVRLKCPVVANPPALTMWQKDGETINSIWERFKVKEAGLRIENVVEEDSGTYTCRGTNGFGTVSIVFTVKVVGRYIYITICC